ncbi:hypothetical protein PPYR_00331 [Photinus pyralis]|uniref:Uncharacterized protein n=2 Tax=Photinus pyralis TaxID=7054 RepID=A0A1Y1K655_PHOPY|nr:uncharacterized protein LOC116158682 [Photinus pyralis]XP_031327367.1 uncharacterized protein LOC116158682 [Photinus pyralis]XP_031327368.1 uncharacterized protein LOC116158683 [Photinus pyralis]KAB0803361.1 hypothetical protein PPYR_00331 [Photinus pyralis]
MIRHLLLMPDIACISDCSGRGECHNGTCVCEIRFSGDHCDGPNLPYHAGIGGVFLLIALVSTIQLLMCIVSEYQRLKTPTFLKACKITTQKLLYFLTFLASAIRGAYFTSPNTFKSGWANSLLSAYYPLLMSGSSLIVCFWAEVFHIPGIQWEKPQFLSKSFIGFLVFNIISYGLLLAEVITTQLVQPPIENVSYYNHIFNGCYAVLLFIVVIFFLIYGVEVFFKVRGGFIKSHVQIAGAEEEPLQTTNMSPLVNNSQLHQSRVGLLSHALMSIIIVGFLFSETLSEFWKTKVPIKSRNFHDVVFRVVEIGLAVWFPAVLWNCISPGELWLLNPRKLLAKLDQKSWDKSNNGEILPESETFVDKQECWICYDLDKPEPLIQPCGCIGDMSSVHHECLRRWLMESSSGSTEALQCKVCKQAYQVKETNKLDWEKGFTAHHWSSTALIITCLCSAVAAAWTVIQLFDDPYIRMISASLAAFVIYICIRFLGQNTLSAYNRAKVGSLSIGSHVTTISGAVTVDLKTTESEPQNL